MAPEPKLHLHLDVALDGGTLTGQIGRDGLPARPFMGWIALNAAIEHLLDDEFAAGGQLPTESEPRMQPETSAPIVIGPVTITFTVEAEHSNGTVTVARCDVPHGAGMPVAHSHDGFEETFYGVEGVTTIVVDGRETKLGPGDTLCVPRGAVHTFASEDGDAAFLAIATPGLFGPEYFLELKAVMDGAGAGPPDPQAVTAVMRRHGLTPAAPA